MQRPALSEVSIRILELNGQLGPIVSRIRSAVDLSPGAEAPLSARYFFGESRVECPESRELKLGTLTPIPCLWSLTSSLSTFPYAHLAVESLRTAQAAV